MDIDDLASQISALERERNWSELTNVTASIFSEDNKLEILAQLVVRVTGLTLQAVVLKGLLYFSQLEKIQYKKLFHLLQNNPVGIYDLKIALITYGGLTKENLQELTGEYENKKESDENTSDNEINATHLDIKVITDPNVMLKRMCPYYEVTFNEVKTLQDRLRSNFRV